LNLHLQSPTLGQLTSIHFWLAEDGDVLLPHELGGAGYPAHGRPERVE